MSEHDELLALAKEIHESDALRYEAEIITLSKSYYVFHRNYEELHKFLEIKNNPQKILELWDLKNRNKLEMFIDELLRLFQNYLASAKSLVAHTRVAIRKWYKDTDFLKEYQDEIDRRFKNNSLADFIGDLRNYNLHYSLPITHARYTIHMDEKEKGKGNIDHSFVLVKKALLTSSSWNWDKGKEYLSKLDGDIDIGKLADEYYRQIANFHSWLINRLKESHKTDFLWLEEMRRKTINMMSEEERKDRGLT